MPQGFTALGERPDLDPLDPMREVKTICFWTTKDALAKSILCDDLRRLDYAKSSNTMLNYFIEARNWFIAQDGPEAGGIGFGFCLEALKLNEHAFIKELRGLWLRQDKIIGTTLREELKAARGATRREKRHKAQLEHGYKHKWAASRRCKLLSAALQIRSDSMDWVGA